MKLVFVLLFTLLFAAATVRGDEPDPRSRLKKRQFKNSKGETLLYRLFVPPDYDAKKRYPVVLFLHGLGERGSDNGAATEACGRAPPDQRDVTAKHACLLVAPSAPTTTYGPRSSWTAPNPTCFRPSRRGRCV